MVASTDWATRLPQGSYRGVPFWFEQDGREGGRRLAVHEFPLAEEPLVEDLGKRAARHRLTAYVNSQFQAAALWNACTAPGLGILVSPTHGFVSARCEQVNAGQELDKLGRIAFQIVFVVDGLSLDAFSLVDAASSLLGLVDGVFNLLPGSVLQALDLVSRIPLIEDLATVALREALTTVRGAVMSVALSATVARDVVASIDTAWTLARSPMSTTPRAVRAMTGALRSIVVTTDADIALTVGTTLSPVPDRGAQPLGRTRKSARAFTTAVDLGLATAATAVVVRQTALIDWASRDEALLARERIRTAVDAIAEPVGASLGEGVYTAMIRLRSEAIEILTERLTTLKPVVAIDTGVSLPSTRIAYELYGRAGPGREIVRRNAAATPALMPTRLEVLNP